MRSVAAATFKTKAFRPANRLSPSRTLSVLAFSACTQAMARGLDTSSSQRKGSGASAARAADPNSKKMIAARAGMRCNQSSKGRVRARPIAWVETGARCQAQGSETMTTLSYCLFDTAIGGCAIAWGEHGLKGVQLPEADADRTRARVARRYPDAVEAEPTDEV